MYKIKKYSYDQAKKLKVDIRPSKYKNKKIDVYKGDVFICSIGDIRYFDFPSYLEINKELAENRRMLYHQRHKKDNILNTKGYYALNILW
jgi:hypothetical protein